MSQIKTKIITLKPGPDCKGSRQVRAAVKKHGYNALHELFSGLKIKSVRAKKS